MSLSFSIKNEVGPARRATLELPHGPVETPVFMPVGTAASVKAVPQDVMEVNGNEGRGAEIILSNTYHLYLRPGHELIRRAGGVHKFMSWNRSMLTDSGGFQVFSLSELRKVTPDGVEFRSHLDGSKHFFSPEHSMEVQIALGADIMMAFDECVETPATWARTKESMSLTHAWAQRSLDYWKEHRHEVPWANPTHPSVARVGHPGYSEMVLGNPIHRDEAVMDGAPRSVTQFEGKHQALFGIVQGGMYKDLRKESAERLVEMDFPGYAIGGLAVGEPREVTREMIAHTLEFLPKDKPRYVMGVGYPDEIVEYARMGVDMMDCVLPTRAGRHGLLFTSEGRINIKNRKFAEDQNPPDPKCSCMVCRRYTRAYLRHLMHSGEPLALTLASEHNLAYYLDQMNALRAELENGRS